MSGTQISRISKAVETEGDRVVEEGFGEECIACHSLHSCKYICVFLAVLAMDTVGSGRRMETSLKVFTW
jgi:hypothetical protein